MKPALCAIGFTLARQLALACRLYASGDRGARFGVRARASSQFGGRQRRNLDLDVDAVQERPRQLAQIARGAFGRAAAATGGVAAPAARAGIHRGNELARGRKVGLSCSAVAVTLRRGAVFGGKCRACLGRGECEDELTALPRPVLTFRCPENLACFCIRFLQR